jgi:hypothetical protein
MFIAICPLVIEIPNPKTRQIAMIVPVCESIALYLIAEPPQLSNSD